MYLQPAEKCYPGCPGNKPVPKGMYGGMRCLCPCHTGGKCLGKQKLMDKINENTDLR